jgi:hypothetical protein
MLKVKKLKRDDPEAEQVVEWLAQDETHQAAGLTLDDLFEEGTEQVLIYDDHGPIMAVRLHRALRVAVQYAPGARLRNARAGEAFISWLRKLAADSKCQEVICRPGGKAVRFAERLGFSDFSGGKFISLFPN